MNAYLLFDIPFEVMVRSVPGDMEFTPGNVAAIPYQVLYKDKWRRVFVDNSTGYNFIHAGHTQVGVSFL